MRFLLRFFARLLFRVRVVGIRAVRHSDRLCWSPTTIRGSTRFCALFLPRAPVIVVPPEETRSRLMRWLLGHVDHEVHDLNNPLSMKPLLRLLRGGRPLLLFPEGRIARNAAVMKVYPVAALIALKSGAAVLPVHVEGAGQWFSRSGSASFLRRLLPSVTMRVFSPTRIDGGAAGSARRRRASQPAGSPRSCRPWRCNHTPASRCSSAFSMRSRHTGAPRC
jgi:acyl-[acyl-carrier-protein]-phospholipid O-acyltransferase/long-chain-fatty-acid--[acyl-carrier-protein] ligase